MPGKVNPTQVEAITMVCAQIMGNNQSVLFANSNGHFQLNVYRPLVIYNVIQSQRLLADSAFSFGLRCVNGIQLNEKKIRENMDKNLMVVTALNSVIGYSRSAKVAKFAQKNGKTLRQAVQELEPEIMQEFDEHMDASKMVKPNEPKE